MNVSERHFALKFIFSSIPCFDQCSMIHFMKDNSFSVIVRSLCIDCGGSVMLWTKLIKLFYLGTHLCM